MLTGKQKRYLRSLAHHLDPIFQVGKGGVNDNMIKQINEALEKRELIKVTVLNNNFDHLDDVKENLLKGTKAELVQVIGHVIILYKESINKKEIKLPR